jgi:hypothetical protein
MCVGVLSGGCPIFFRVEMNNWIDVIKQPPPILADTGKSFIGGWLNDDKSDFETIDHLTFDGEWYWNQNSCNHSTTPDMWLDIPEL